eukprot:9421019-Pyramimonas_sp.AAC.1
MMMRGRKGIMRRTSNKIHGEWAGRELSSEGYENAKEGNEDNQDWSSKRRKFERADEEHIRHDDDDDHDEDENGNGDG